MEDNVLNAALAGLLHDVGKVIQRSKTDPWLPPEDVKDSGQPVHAAWSIAFIQNYIPAPYRAAALSGAYHHHPDRHPGADNRLSCLTALADKLSAGERAELSAESQKTRPPQQMVSIFERVSLSSRTDNKTQYHYLPLKELQLADDALFPDQKQMDQDTGEAYDALRSLLESEAGQNDSERETYLEHLLFLMQRATWSVPSAYYHHLPDISLYDHSRMTAALAACLAEFDPLQIDDLLESVQRVFHNKEQAIDQQRMAQPVALLVGGDISGIQDFIFTISSKNAARMLRGRSFYLQLLTEAILRYTLRQLGVPYTNVIYSGGGHFFLLAPLSAKPKIDDLKSQIARKLLRHHGSDLYVALSAVEVPAGGFRLGKLPDYWDTMHAGLAQAKQRRYSELHEEMYQLVFEPQPHGGNQDLTCAVCGNENDKRTVSDLVEDDPEEIGLGAKPKICGLCLSFDEQIGALLPAADYVLLGLGDPQERQPGSAADALVEFGLSFAFGGKALKPQSLSVNGFKARRVCIWRMDDSDGKVDTGGLPAAVMKRYTVNRIPLENNRVKTFDKLQKETEGIERLGVLRMDVDNLGEIFKRGFGEKDRSIATVARLSMLSFQMSLFFEGWVKCLSEKEHPNKVYAVYAGGDDLFLIAPWHLVPDLAEKIVEAFTRYTAANPDLHLSGGMSFIHGKYPVYQAAADAHEALEQAKSLDGKNAFNFLDQSWHWEEFRQVSASFEKLKAIVQKKEKGGMVGPQSLLQTLRRLAGMQAEKARRIKNKPVWGPWMYLGDYTLKRMIERAKDMLPLAEALGEVYQCLSGNSYLELPRWGLAARWSQIYVREKKKDDELQKLQPPPV